jgi:hypothetical protein
MLNRHFKEAFYPVSVGSTKHIRPCIVTVTAGHRQQMAHPHRCQKITDFVRFFIGEKRQNRIVDGKQSLVHRQTDSRRSKTLAQRTAYAGVAVHTVTTILPRPHCHAAAA